MLLRVRSLSFPKALCSHTCRCDAGGANNPGSNQTLRSNQLPCNVCGMQENYGVVRWDMGGGNLADGWGTVWSSVTLVGKAGGP